MTTITAAARGGSFRRGAKGPTVALIQLALRAAGHELLIDEDFGGVTYEAVRRFQAALGLKVDGAVGYIQTAPALDRVLARGAFTGTLAEPSVLGVAPWLSVMRAITGTQEIPGAMSNPLILGWRDELIRRYPDMKPNLSWYVNDDTPWCGLGLAYVVGVKGFKPPVAPLRALNWQTWDQELREGALGAILVFKRDGGGHVGLYEGEDPIFYHVRGCNQSNTVNVARIEKRRCVSIRWPSGHALPSSGPVFKSAAGAVSSNEA